MKTLCVKEVYETIASHFSDTRYSHWKCVRDFLDMFEPGLLIGDIGCGNGKNMLYRKDLEFIGCDITENLVQIAREKTGNEIIVADGTNLPFVSELFNVCMSVAVIHHLSSTDFRKKFVQEMVRCTEKNGLVMFTVWIRDQPLKKKWVPIPDGQDGDYLIPWHIKNRNNKNGAEVLQRYYHLFTEQEVFDLIPSNCILEKITSECYNYCVILRKIL
jgi:SAM-dependent methyltransferase